MIAEELRKEFRNQFKEELNWAYKEGAKASLDCLKETYKQVREETGTNAYPVDDIIELIDSIIKSFQDGLYDSKQ